MRRVTSLDLAWKWVQVRPRSSRWIGVSILLLLLNIICVLDGAAKAVNHLMLHDNMQTGWFRHGWECSSVWLVKEEEWVLGEEEGKPGGEESEAEGEDGWLEVRWL